MKNIAFVGVLFIYISLFSCKFGWIEGEKFMVSGIIIPK